MAVAQSPANAPRFELWAGAEASKSAFSIYSGTVWAPIGSVREDGWRLRAGGGWGRYHYDTAGTRIDGEASFADLLAGYHAQIGDLTVKAYAGIAGDGHLLTPADPDNALGATAFGPKAILETWLNVSSQVWTAVDLAWTGAHSQYAGKLRLGWRLDPDLSLGVEAGGVGNVESDSARTGAFLRWEWASGEISATGGLTGALRAPQTPFAAVSLTTKF